MCFDFSAQLFMAKISSYLVAQLSAKNILYLRFSLLDHCCYASTVLVNYPVHMLFLFCLFICLGISKGMDDKSFRSRSFLFVLSLMFHAALQLCRRQNRYILKISVTVLNFFS